MAFNWIKFGEINETFDNIRNMNDADLDHFLHTLIQYCYDRGWNDYDEYVNVHTYHYVDKYFDSPRTNRSGIEYDWDIPTEI